MRLLRLSLLINYFSITKNVKKAVTAINIGIFLSIFAASSAVISLYIENEISDLEYELTSMSDSKRYQERATAKIPALIANFNSFLNMEKTYRDFHEILKFTKFGNKAISNEDMYIPLFYDIGDLVGLDDIFLEEEFDYFRELINEYPEDTKKRYLKVLDDFPLVFKQIIPEDKIKEFNNILFNSSYENLLNEINDEKNQLIFDGEHYIYSKKTNELVNYTIDFIDMMSSLSLYVVEIHKVTIEELNNEIIKKSKLEKDLVFFIFILQFLVFLIVQFFELSSLSLGNKIKKAIK